MSVSLPEDIQGLDAANAELDRLFAADEAEAAKGNGSAKAADEAAGQRAAQTGETQQTEAKGTESETETAQQKQQQKQQETKSKEQEQQAAAKGKEPSRYEKARERQQKSWEELNAQKDALKREREEFDRAKAEHDQRLAEQEKEFSPEAYDSAAKKFEEAGKFDLAELARAKAADLRKNPPAKPGENPAAKEWALKAGIDFPDLAKTNSPLQVRVAQLFKEEPDLKAHPKGIYVAARIASLELERDQGKAAGAAVAEKDKEIEKLKAKVKELEGLTAPGAGGTARLPESKDFSDKSDEEQWAELQQLARETGALR